MGACLAILIALLSLLSSETGSAATVRDQCRTCHPVHYADQGSCTHCHRGDHRTSRKELAHSTLIIGRYASFTNPHAPALKTGNRLAESAACRRCHLLGGSGNRLAANLDSLLGTSSPEAIRTALIRPAIYMPEYHFSERNLDSLITAVLAGGYRHGTSQHEPPQVVHFHDQQTDTQNIFAKQCGGCHKMLSQKYGGLGNGSAGPNLAGLLSRFYPTTFAEGQAWNEERLSRWLKNPRGIKRNSVMRPIRLKTIEWQLLVNTLKVAYPAP